MCNYQGNSLTNNVYLCKQDLNNNKCEESIPRSSQRLIQAGLSVALTQVSLADNGVYWCAFRKDNYQGAYQKIVLSVKGETKKRKEKLLEQHPSSMTYR